MVDHSSTFGVVAQKPNPRNQDAEALGSPKTLYVESLAEPPKARSTPGADREDRQAREQNTPA